MESLEQYRERMPLFCAECLKQICVPETHPKYQDYLNDAIWKYLFGDQIVSSLSAFFDLKGKKVLDIGAGSGGLSTAFAKMGAIVTALDVDSGYERLSKIGYQENHVQVESKLFDGENYPFPDESFDIVCFFNIYEHVPDVKVLYRAMSRLVKKSGFIIGRVDYKWSKENIKHDPHYGLPVNILLPRFLRKILVVNIFKRSPVVEDYRWAPSFRAVKQEASAFGLNTIRYWDGSNEADDNIIFRKKEQSAPFPFGSGKMDLENHFWFSGLHNMEDWSGMKVRWSSANFVFRLLNFSRIQAIEFDVLVIEPKTLFLKFASGGSRKFELEKTNAWQKIRIELTDALYGGGGTEELLIEFSTTPIPRELLNQDTRELGVAIKDVLLYGEE